MLSRHATPLRSLPAFASGDVVRRRNRYPPDYRTAFAYSEIPYRAPLSVGLTTSLPTRRQERYGLTLFPLNDKDGLGSLSTPAALVTVEGENQTPVPSCVAYLAPAYQHVWPVVINGAYESSHMLTMPSTLAPDRLMLAVVALPRGRALRPTRRANGPRDTLSECFRRFVTLPP